jgi:hypothetical protein
MWMYVWFGLAMLQAVVILWLVVMVLRLSERNAELSEALDGWIEEVDRLDARILEYASNRLALLTALREIAAQETPGANATAKRMARIAREALS